MIISKSCTLHLHLHQIHCISMTSTLFNSFLHLHYKVRKLCEFLIFFKFKVLNAQWIQLNSNSYVRRHLKAFIDSHHWLQRLRLQAPQMSKRQLSSPCKTQFKSWKEGHQRLTREDGKKNLIPGKFKFLNLTFQENDGPLSKNGLVIGSNNSKSDSGSRVAPSNPNSGITSPA